MGSLGSLDLRLLQVFLAVVESRGLSAAQSSLNLGLSTISMHVTSLEKRLGVRLCERGRSGFRLTAEGQKVYEASRRLVGAVSEANSEFAALRNVLIGRLRIGVVDNVANNPAAQLHVAINRFDSRLSEVSISVEVISPRDLERHVSEGLVDVGIGPGINFLGGLDYVELFRERQFLYCGSLHTGFHKAAMQWSVSDMTMQKYAGHVCPLPEKLMQHHTLHSVSAVHNMESVALLILSGRFIGYLPEHYALQWVNADKMRPILPEEFHYDNLFFSILRKRNAPNRIAKQFAKDLKHAQTYLA